jgi:Fe-S-cluster containining protein
MSPLSMEDVPCQYLIKSGTFYFCSVYDKRPEQCKNHDFPVRFCPIGISILKPTGSQEISERIDAGWELIKKGEASP